MSSVAEHRLDIKTYGDVLELDTRPVPETLRVRAPCADDTSPISVDRYISRDIHELEKQLLWPKTWQWACREEHIPNIGDTYTYDINDISILVVRTQHGIKAFYNACLHQGRQLRETGGPATELRCPYHGFCWSLEGKLKSITLPKEFPHLLEGRGDKLALKELRVGVWAGFVFVNMDHDGESFEKFLGTLPAHLQRSRLGERYIRGHVVKLLRCNWKVAQEAFMDHFHLFATHPQQVDIVDVVATQNDEFHNFSRSIGITGVPSPNVRNPPSETEMYRMLNRYRGKPDTTGVTSIPPGRSAREFAAERLRGDLRPVLAGYADELCDSEVLDQFIYTVFPNFHPWGGVYQLCYRFRPWHDNHEECIFEVFLLAPFTGDRPAPAEPFHLGFDDEFYKATILGHFARIMDQDLFNMEKVQRGLHTLAWQGLDTHLAIHAQDKIRHFHRWYNDLLGLK
jgi:phenylpropionate dioxygenase-like ring-hydroxylating dioxygenase large terminal subunit